MGELTDLERYVFDTCGVLIRKQAFPLAEVVEACRYIQEQIAPETWKFPTLRGAVFKKWMTAEQIFKPIQEMCGPHVRLDHAFGVRGGSVSKAPAQLHGGPDSSQHSCFYHDVGKAVGLVGQLSVGVTLVGQTPESGGFCYLPGSHKAYSRVEGKDIFLKYMQRDVNHPAIVVPTLEPGDLIFFSESLVHGDTGPRIPAERLMAYYKFTPGWMCWRDPRQQERYRQLAENDREALLLEPPWTGQFNDLDDKTLSVSNVRRPPHA